MTTAQPPTPLSILLVEADEGDAVLVQECLLRAGFAEGGTTWVRSIADAHRALADQPRVVILDINMPDAAGIELVRDIVGRAPDIPVIVLTDTPDARESDALAVGAQDYIAKDEIGPDLLGRSVRYAVERKRVQLTQLQLRDAQLNTAEKARLERGLLPTPLLRTDRVSCSTYYRPGRNHAVLGGDFFDVVETPDGRIRAVVGDVMGHGPDEAALGVHLRVAWRTLVLAGAEDTQVLPQLAALLTAETAGMDAFVTACDVTIDPDAETALVRVAGHPAPLVCSEGKTSYTEVETGLPLGVDPGDGDRDRWAATGGWPESRVELPRGSSIILYTDGLLDAYAVESDPDSIGLEELVHAVLALAEGGGDVSSWIRTIIGSAPNQSPDDTAVVVLTTSGPEEP
jgi:serine phosphatase RsbU (regulator of sigma subunit)